MKRTITTAFAVAAIMTAAVMTTACSNDSDDLTSGDDFTAGDGSAVAKTEVTLTFSPYTMEAMTRTATSIASVVTHLDVWLVEGSNMTVIHQTSSDAVFGTITATLDKTKTYTLYAIGHKADGATLSDGVISFTDDKVTHSMFYTTTFSPATTTSLSCLMTRIVADFRLEITDEIPAAVKKLRFTVSDVFDRWSVTDGGTHQLDRTSLITYNGTSAVFNIYAIVTDAQTTHTVTVTALDENDQELQTRTFADVPLRNGYKTNYRGTFFIDSGVSSSFTVDDWNEYDIVDF